MGKILKQAIVKNLWFYILAGIAIAFLVASFVVPPLGVISPSVLEGVAEIFAFATLGTVIKAIDKGIDSKIKKGDIEVEIGDFNNNNSEDK